MCKYKVEDWVEATELIIKPKPTDYECTFSRGKAGPRPLPRGCTCKNSNGDGSSNFVGFEIWVNPVFFSGGVENWRYFFRLHKATATVALFHPQLQCNCQKLLRCHRE